MLRAMIIPFVIRSSCIIIIVIIIIIGACS